MADPLTIHHDHLYGILARRLASLAPASDLKFLQKFYREALARTARTTPHCAEEMAYRELDCHVQAQYGWTLAVTWFPTVTTAPEKV